MRVRLLVHEEREEDSRIIELDTLRSTRFSPEFLGYSAERLQPSSRVIVDIIATQNLKKVFSPVEVPEATYTAPTISNGSNAG